MQKHLSGASLRKIIIGAAAALDKNKAYIDSLNVFPVPDGDTGTNMSLTMKSVVREVEAVNTNDLVEICEAISRGALRGARGNSGVILSQILKGMMTEVRACRDQKVTVRQMAKSMAGGAKVAYSAVTAPKEGTILTVIRVMAEDAKGIAAKSDNFEEFLSQILMKGEEILAQTPDMLPVLKKAGVVDAGGKGLLYIFQGFLAALRGEEVDAAAFTGDDNAGDTHNIEYGVNFEDLAEIEFAYCTEFLIGNISKATTLASIDQLRDKLVGMGDSVVCVGDLSLVKVHVHTNTPGIAITEALQLGEIISLKVENMLQQNRELRASRKIPEKEQGIVSVAAGEGLSSIFKDLGVDIVIKGGQTMNPSADDIAKAADRVNAKTVFVFPNNKNIILAARHAQSLVDKNLVVIPTRTINEGIAACIVYNSENSVEENTDGFLSAMTTVKSGSVTYAVRNTKMDRFDIKEGEILGLDSKTIIAKGKTVSETTTKLIEKLMSDNASNITLFYGEEVKEKEANALQEKLAQKYPKCDVNVISGGQPVYYYLISVE
jgi:hypothetical protein